MQKKAGYNDLNIEVELTDVNLRNDLKKFLNGSDTDIWKAFRNGNEAAFIHIYKNYYDSLVTYGVNFTSDRELIRDCIQDMYVELREKRTKLGNTDAIKPYIFVIFRRKLNKYIKIKQRHSGTELQQVHDKFHFEISYEQHLINKQLSKEQIQSLNIAIGELTNQEREIVFLYFYEGHSYSQIAEIMGYGQIKTARSLLYKALASLRKTLYPQDPVRTLYLLFF